MIISMKKIATTAIQYAIQICIFSTSAALFYSIVQEKIEL